MTSVARAHWDFVFWEGADGVHAGIQGPESCASQAPVPNDAEFLGVRMALGAFVPTFPMPALVDGFVEFPVDGDWFYLAGDRIRKPRFGDAEEFVAGLARKEILVVPDIHDRSVTDRTRQRRYLAAVGLPQRTVHQIDRANDAAVRLGEGQQWASFLHDSGYFDQPHMARSLRRFIGRSATELTEGATTGSPLSLLYKTGSRYEQ
ncbi:hypothetical protein [Jongsikchunia kroppenstedtii]|uniref:hypothetical protein n=1 Tax=Jongsikchunia kroppenstedtii TaxID=1121721 RepID=UPI00035C1739|nr:hypothetical protein [Jongsikchunia kroppenstedtii]